MEGFDLLQSSRNYTILYLKISNYLYYLHLKAICTHLAGRDHNVSVDILLQYLSGGFGRYFEHRFSSPKEFFSFLVIRSLPWIKRGIFALVARALNHYSICTWSIMEWVLHLIKLIFKIYFLNTCFYMLFIPALAHSFVMIHTLLLRAQNICLCITYHSFRRRGRRSHSLYSLIWVIVLHNCVQAYGIVVKVTGY